ncbi:MAG: hypothetical protein JNG84_13145 [Archangium sp.]|nr:hypothetical protein [Archangium sp.]
MRTHFLRLHAVALLMSLAGASCSNCGAPPRVQKDQCLNITGADPLNADACTDDSSCGGGDSRYSCRVANKDTPDLKCCMFTDRTCNSEADCCPGQTCPSDRKKCFDRFTECTNDADCGDKGDKVCEVYSDFYTPNSRRCRFKACSAVGQCPEGQSCFQGECMVDLPCNGTCESGKGCVASIDRCQDYAAPTGRTAAACPMTCNAGFIASFKDGRNIWDSCTLSAVQCVCAELPTLRSGDLGRFSAVDADPSRGVVSSMYDGEYGDLVVMRFGLDGAKLSTEYVDGVPQAPVKYGPSGARGGIVEPGNDVGRYTDVAVNNGITYVSYYDATNGDLKVAVKQSTGTWSSHRVDGLTGDMGLYTSIGVDQAGNPGVSYFMRAADTSFSVSDCPGTPPAGDKKFITAVRFARATKAIPTIEADWVVKTVACMSRPPPPCDGCSGSNVCVTVPGSGPQCLAASTACSSCDTNSQACVLVSNAPTCASKYTPSTLADVPMGVGVFSALAFDGNEAVISYMRRTIPVGGTLPDGDLYAVRIDASNVVGTPVVISSTGDTGFFPSVRIEPTSKAVAIAFHDFSTKTFKFYYSPTLQPNVTLETIDTGVDMTRPGEQSFSGTDSALVFGPQVGQLWAVYQDSTRGDLKMAKRATTWTPQTVASEGAVGFFADGVFLSGKIYATHARLRAKQVSGQARLDNALILEQIPAN